MSEPGDRARRRKRLLLRFTGVLLLSAGLWWTWTTFFAGDTVSTENAYTAVELAQITPQIVGPVKSVQVVDTQAVKKGDILVQLDDTDTRIAVAQAEAELARAEQRVRQIFAQDMTFAGQLSATSSTVQSTDADLQRVRADLRKAELDAKRRQDLVRTGAISVEELNNAETLKQKAQAAVAQAVAVTATARASGAAAKGDPRG
jgi:Multidrug resistance efflux pump